MLPISTWENENTRTLSPSTVEIDSTFTFSTSVALMRYDESSFNQKVDDEWKPNICSKCGWFHEGSFWPAHQERKVVCTFYVILEKYKLLHLSIPLWLVSQTMKDKPVVDSPPVQNPPHEPIPHPCWGLLGLYPDNIVPNSSLHNLSTAPKTLVAPLSSNIGKWLLPKANR